MSKMIIGLEVNRAGLADILGISVVTLDKWLRQGCPYITRGSQGHEWRLNTAHVINWRLDQLTIKATRGKI